MCSCRSTCCANLYFVLYCRSLLRQLQKLQALVRRSAPKTTRRKTCTMVSGFNPSVCGGVPAVLTCLGERYLLHLVMPVHLLC